MSASTAGAKQKLLEVLGDTELADIEVERLADICADKIRCLETTINRLHSENAIERQRLRDTREAALRDMQEMRRNPLFGAHGYYRFDLSNDERVIVSARSGQIYEVVVRRKGIDTLCQPMPLEAP